MKNGERKIVAVVATWEDEENLNLFLSHLIHAVEGTDLLPLFLSFDRITMDSRGEEGLCQFLTMLNLKDLAGLVLLGEMIRSDAISNRLIDLAQERKVPVFMLERQYDRCINLPFDYHRGFEQVARHMVEHHGCRDVVFVAGIKGNSYSEDRIRLTRAILEEHGASLPENQVIYGDYWDVPTVLALRQYFEQGGHFPKAFLCANDAMAVAVCDNLRKRGKNVPEDILVSGFDGTQFSERHDPTVTTARPDLDALFRILVERIERWDPRDTGKTEVIPIPCTLMCRQSCGCDTESHFSPSEEIAYLTTVNLDYSRHIRYMASFVRKTLNMDAMEDLVASLPQVFASWPDPYYCITRLDEKNPSVAETILHGDQARFSSGIRFRWPGVLLPDFDRLCADPSICIVMGHLLQSMEETMGFIVCGMRTCSLRDQQRFEEQAMFMSAALSAVLNNHRLKEANEAIRNLAEHDSLTGLYNRRGFLGRLNRLLEAPGQDDRILSLFSMDLDGLKMINDVYGHLEGDHAIQSLGRALSELPGPDVICARFGGDEFAFAMLTETAPPDPEALRSHLEERARFFCGQRPWLLSASIGVSSSSLRNHPKLEKMMAAADRSLYTDKARRKARG